MEKVKTSRKITTQCILILLFIVVSYLIFAPVTRGHYFNGEDYAQIWVSIWEDEINAPSYFSILRIVPWEGRPLERLYTYLVFNKYINSLKSVEAANTVRFMGIIGTGFLAYVLFLIFKVNRFRLTHAFLLSILICTLPPIQTYVGRVYTVVFVLSVLLSALAALILFKVVFTENGEGGSYKALAFFSAIILLIISMNIYQPAAMSYWAFAVIPLIHKKKEITKKDYLPFSIYFFAGISSMLIYFGLTKIIGVLLNTGFTGRGSFIHPNEIYDTIVWFIKYPLYGALNLWNIFPNKTIALFAGIILSGIIYSFLREVIQVARREKEAGQLFKYLIVFLVIPLSYLPKLVVKEHPQIVPLHRTLIGLEITLLLLLYWRLRNIAEFSRLKLNFPEKLQEKIVTTGFIIITVGSAFLANHNVYEHFAKLHGDQLQYVKEAIREYGVSRLPMTSRIYIIKPDKLSAYEFGVITSGEGSSIAMVKLALYELGINSNAHIEPIRFKKLSEIHLSESSNVLIIDLNKFQLQSSKSTEFVEY